MSIVERDGEKLDMTGMYIPTPANGAVFAQTVQSPNAPNPIMRRQSVTFSPIMEEKEVIQVDGATKDITEKGAAA